MEISNLLQMAGAAAGGGVITMIVQKLFERPQSKAGTIKLRNESGQIVLEGELKVTEFYKEQLEIILSKYEELERRLEVEIEEHKACQKQITELESKHNDLQRQFTLLKMELNP
jgi:septal ring factor EnvC (AmiA/AmiB activator)